LAHRRIIDRRANCYPESSEGRRPLVGSLDTRRSAVQRDRTYAPCAIHILNACPHRCNLRPRCPRAAAAAAAAAALARIVEIFMRFSTFSLRARERSAELETETPDTLVERIPQRERRKFASSRSTSRQRRADDNIQRCSKFSSPSRRVSRDRDIAYRRQRMKKLTPAATNLRGVSRDGTVVAVRYFRITSGRRITRDYARTLR